MAKFKTSPRHESELRGIWDRTSVGTDRIGIERGSGINSSTCTYEGPEPGFGEIIIRRQQIGEIGFPVAVIRIVAIVRVNMRSQVVFLSRESAYKGFYYVI